MPGCKPGGVFFKVMMVIMVVVMFNLVVTHTAKKSVGLPPRDFDGDDGDAAALVMTDDGVKEYYDGRYQ